MTVTLTSGADGRRLTTNVYGHAGGFAFLDGARFSRIWIAVLTPRRLFFFGDYVRLQIDATRRDRSDGSNTFTVGPVAYLVAIYT